MKDTFMCRLLGLSLLSLADLLTCSSRASMTATSLSFLVVFGLPILFSSILPIDIKSPSRSGDVLVMLDLSSVVWSFAFFFSLLFVAFSCNARYPSQLLLIWRTWMGFWAFWRWPLSGAIEACAARLYLHSFSVGFNPETSMALI